MKSIFRYYSLSKIEVIKMYRAELISSSETIVILNALVKTPEGNTEKQTNLFDIRPLAWAAWILGRLGGWKGYKSESATVPRIMKRGLVKFRDFLQGWILANGSDLT
jgi:hypothetical protein|tara:strand:- start:167 stop:487 length:321 start_codon:yes stop_codon:yes gene_type:complete